MLNRLLTPKEMMLLVAFSLAILVGSVALWYNNQKSREDSTLGVLQRPESGQKVVDIILYPEPQEMLEEIVDSGPIAVAVAGAVRREGLYWLEPGARVLDLIGVAGGEKEGAYLACINRGAHLVDGTTLTVPWEDYTATEGEREQYRRWGAGVYLNPAQYLHQPWAGQVEAQFAAAPASAGGTSRVPGAVNASATSGCINLNTATLAEVETLPGIGPVIGQRILDYRDQYGFREIGDLMKVSGIAEKRFEAIAHLVCL